jgi:hypothetical protein
MKIKDILTLDVGVSGLSASGIVKKAMPSRNVSGEHNGKPYSFWSSFVVLKEDGSEIGIDLNSETALTLHEGDTITVEKGKLDSYKDKKGNVVLILRKCKLKEGSVTSTATTQQSQKSGGDNLEMLLSYAKDVAIANHTTDGKIVTTSEITTMAKEFKDWIDVIRNNKAVKPEKSTEEILDEEATKAEQSEPDIPY